MENESTAIEVTVRITPEALPRLRRMVPVAGQAGVPLSATEEVEVTVPFESEGWARWALLGLGAAVEVLRPTAMRQLIADEVRGAAARYTRPT